MRVAAACLGISVVGACSSFGSGGAPIDPAADGGSLDGSTSGADGASDLGRDGGVTTACTIPKPATSLSSSTNVGARLVSLVGGPAGVNGTAFWGITTNASRVFWIEQSGTDAFDGHATASIKALGKGGSDVLTIASNQTQATTLAVAGTYLYWGAQTEPAMNTWSVMRVDAACAAPCLPETVGALPEGATIDHLVAVGPNQLLAVSESSGTTFSIDPTSADAHVKALLQTGTASGVTASGANHFWYADEAMPVLGEVVDGKLTKPITIPGAPLALAGSRVLANDCAKVYVPRYPFTGGLLRLDRFDIATSTSDALSFNLGPSPVAGAVDVYDMAVDQSYAYVAIAQGGPGVVALDVANPGKGSITITKSRVYRIAVDDDDVYFGEHEPGAVNHLYRLPKN